MNIGGAIKSNDPSNAVEMGVAQQFRRKRMVHQKIGANLPITKRRMKPGEKLGANLPLFWNNDGKDRLKGKICPLAKKEVFD
jgi:hypothetical protein